MTGCSDRISIVFWARAARGTPKRGYGAREGEKNQCSDGERLTPATSQTLGLVGLCL